MSVQRSRAAALAATGAACAARALGRAFGLRGSGHEAEILGLRARLDRALAECGAAVAERDRLLCEVNHRVKNNLQLVDSLVVLYGRNVEADSARKALDALRGALFTLGLAHRHVMASSDLQTLELGPFLDDLAREVPGDGAPAVRLSVEVATLRADLDFAIPLGLLFAELVASARTHARHDRAGRIEASLSSAGLDRLRLEVMDNGWIPEPPIPARRMADPIVEALLRQLGAALTVTVGHRVCVEAEMARPATP